MIELFEPIKVWFLGLGDNYGVNPIIFGSIYVGAIPFFTLSIGWLVKNLKKQKSIILPILSASFCFVSAYLYLIIVGKNVPLWVYLFVVIIIIFGAYSAVRKVRKQIKASKLPDNK